MDPLSITQAIVELGAPRLEAAAEYARTCLEMLSAGVPRSEVPRVIDIADVDVRPTHALKAISQWANERRPYDPEGLLGICGPVGVGKSWAAARLVLSRLREGKRTCWLPLVNWPAHDLDAQGQWVAAADRAPLLVLDDLGAGLTNPKPGGGGYGGHLRSVVEGVLLRAIADGRPAILISNGTKAEVCEYLDGRIVDRVAMAGGFVEIKRDEKSLREPSPTNLDKLGRWPRWAESAILAGFFGEGGQRFLLEAQRLNGARDRDALLDHHRRGSSLLDLERGDVIERAKAIDARTADLLAEASRVLHVEVAEPTFEAVAEALARRTGAKGSPMPEYVGPRNYPPPPELPRLDSDRARRAREVMAPLGYTVKPSNVSGHIIRHGDRALSFDWPSAEQAWISIHMQHEQHEQQLRGDAAAVGGDS